MLVSTPAEYGSKFTIFAVYRITISPPYCGFPSESHHFPVVVVVGVVFGVEIGDVVGLDIVVVVLDIGVDVDMDVEVEVVQDAKTSDISVRQVNTIQIAPLFFIFSS
jgi:hypothetical protein